jgi:hypothetical protein
MDEYRRGRIDGAKAEAALWSEWILMDPLVRAEWGNRGEFSADDAASLTLAMAHELKALRTPECAELQRRIDVLVEENLDLQRRLSEK